MEQNAFHLKMRLDHVGIITIDVPGEKMNTLKAEFAGRSPPSLRRRGAIRNWLAWC